MRDKKQNLYKKCIFIHQRLLYFLIFLHAISCEKDINKIKSIPEIDIETTINSMDESSKIEIFSEINYIMLETSKESIISEYPRFYCDEKHIVSNAFRQILLFNKNTGSFEKELGVRDKSPTGYAFTLGCIAFDEKNKIIYAADWNRNYIGYNFNGEITKSIKLPHKYISSAGIVNDSVFAGYISGYIKHEEIKIINFRKNGEVIKIFPNNLPYGNIDGSFMYSAYEGIFYRTNNSLCFKEIYNDTLYQVKNDSLLPRFVFKMGKYSPPPEKRSELEEIITRDKLGNVTWLLDNYVETKYLCESVRYILFEFKYQTVEYWGFYDKKTGETHIRKNEDNITVNGIGMPFRLTRTFINQKNQELVTFIDAFELVLWVESNPEKVKALPQEVHQQFKEVKDSDNPVVIIAKLKE